jgi:aminomethyltransferase
MSEQGMQRTVLFETHRALHALMVPFGGFEMPVQYTGIHAEHAAVRTHAGLFDLSHMAQFEVFGDAAAAWLDELTVNHVATMKPFAARYNIFTNERGGALDDTIIYRLPDRWLVVINAGNAPKMAAYLAERADARVRVVDRRADRALLAVQGPKSVAVLASLASVDLSVLKYYSCIAAEVAGVPALVARTGYTGEDGFELFLDAAAATIVWERVLAAGAPLGLIPAGLGARDVLRLEAGMPLYGHELDEDLGPIQAGLDWAVKFAKPAFPGRSALEAQVASGAYPRIVGVMLDGKVPARAGYAVLADGAVVGEIRSGAIAPSLDRRSIGTALVAAGASSVGTRISVEVRGTLHPAEVVALPFYSRPRM